MIIIIITVTMTFDRDADNTDSMEEKKEDQPEMIPFLESSVSHCMSVRYNTVHTPI